jgi:putative peptidoglycan lipid II flippase
VVGGWLVAVAADLVLAQALAPADRAFALGLGHTLGVTVAGLGLLVVVARTTGTAALAGAARAGSAALVGAAAAAVAGLAVAGALDADPVPAGVPAAVGAGLLVAAIALLLALAVIMGIARGPLTAAVRALRAVDRQEVSRG